ncbi:MAG TPA: hypothetical protein VK590_09485 [Saprospiraceae bacterium]|nr:hypothetical protein [Saprospiraceae bacterium]
MTRNFFFILLVSLFVFFSSCEKNEYNSLSGNITLSGYANQVDSFSNLPPIPIVGQKVYLNTGSDTSSYIFQTTTDSVGVFNIPALKDNHPYVLFCRFIKNNTEYAGAIKFKGAASNSSIHVILNVYPSHYNGMSILFTDGNGGAVPNLPFRLYTSRIMAEYDSLSYAYTKTTTSINGRFNRYNVSSAKYYVVSSQIIGPTELKIFDSLTVQSFGVIKDTVILH